jgi:hypothetical protein
MAASKQTKGNDMAAPAKSVTNQYLNAIADFEECKLLPVVAKVTILAFPIIVLITLLIDLFASCFKSKKEQILDIVEDFNANGFNLDKVMQGVNLFKAMSVGDAIDLIMDQRIQRIFQAMAPRAPAQPPRPAQNLNNGPFGPVRMGMGPGLMQDLAGMPDLAMLQQLLPLMGQGGMLDLAAMMGQPRD